MSEDAQHDEEAPSRQGTLANLTTPQKRSSVFRQALDYRGDVTVKTISGELIRGYIFDRDADADGPYVRMVPTDGSGRRKIHERQIQALHFTGRDTAAGKSWRTWVKHYQQKVAAGESADLHPDPID